MTPEQAQQHLNALNTNPYCCIGRNTAIDALTTITKGTTNDQQKPMGSPILRTNR